jgi:hypothetical protein
MRVICASTAGAGHFSPMVPWIEHLIEVGNEVLIVGPPGLGPTAARWDFRAGETADPAEVEAIMGRAMASRHEDAADMVIGEVFTRLNSGSLVPAMRAVIAEFRPHLVLRDPAEFASALCAAEGGVRQIRIGHGLSTGEETLLRHARPILEEWSTGLTDVVAHSAYFTRFPGLVDPPTFAATRRYREGAPHQHGRTQGDGERPFVYVTLGTVAPTIPPLLPWYAVLLQALDGLPVSAQMTTGRDLKPASVGTAPSNVEVTDWADQRAALARAAVIVHHGGSGTVLGALEAGCPHVVVPLFADQGENAAMVERAGLGLAVADQGGGGPAAIREPDPGDAQRIHDSLQRVLAADQMRLRSREVAAQISDLPALPEVSLISHERSKTALPPG